MFPSIEPGEVGLTGLIWLFFSYGYVLFRASNLISEGSELLLLVPSLAGLVGGVVLPLLGAVPDGAIMLFSGMGDIEKAQESLSVGIGALAGSTIMLLTIPWALSVVAGRVLIVENDQGKTVAAYSKSGKNVDTLPVSKQISTTGVALTASIQHGSVIMVLTTIPYFLIQVPALFLKGDIASGEKNWALGGFVACIIGFVYYLHLQLKASKADEEKFHRMQVISDLLTKGKVSLGGAFFDIIETFENSGESVNGGESDPLVHASAKVKEALREVLHIPFQKYDIDSNDQLEFKEVKIFLRDFNENCTDEEVKSLFNIYDKDESQCISFDEFVECCYTIIKKAHNAGNQDPQVAGESSTDNIESGFSIATMENEDEHEEVPPKIADLPPAEQQAAIKKMAFSMLAFGTGLVLLFADPMVDVMQEIAYRINISPFYVSFVLAPLASNASEVIASQYYAAKKTTKTITVSLSALQGAACMNNTFCLSIFMGLIYFRGLAWQYTAETISIVLVQIYIYAMTRGDVMTVGAGLMTLTIFPFSIAFVAVLEGVFGLD